jgi:two-component sensor histidine kinase
MSAHDFGVVADALPEAIIVDDTQAAGHPTPLDRLLAPEGARTYLYAPMVVQEQRVGWLIVHAGHPDALGHDHLAIATQVAASLGIAVRQAQLHEQTQQDAAAKAALLQEVNHRVRNNLSAIVGLLQLEQRHARPGDAAAYSEMVSDLVKRVQAMAAIHNLLSASGWSPVSFGQLVTQIVQTVIKTLPAHKRLSLQVDAPPVLLKSDQAHHLALVIAELTTNAVKYALGEREQVTVSVQARQSAGWLEFEFRDDGPGYPDDTLRMECQQIGFQLIQKIVAQNLHGEVHLHNDGGAVAVVRFRLKK